MHVFRLYLVVSRYILQRAVAGTLRHAAGGGEIDGLAITLYHLPGLDFGDFLTHSSAGSMPPAHTPCGMRFEERPWS